MRKSTYKSDILFVLISTFIVVSIWVGSDIYNKSVTSTLDETLQYQISPITNTFDLKTIEKIRSRKKVAPLYSEGPIERVSPTPSPTPEPEVPAVEPTEQPALGEENGI